MTLIHHNLDLPRYAVAVRFEDETHNPMKGGVFSIHDDDTIEIDDEWLNDHPEIFFVVVFGVGYEYEDKKFGWSRYGHVEEEKPLALQLMLDFAISGLVCFIRNERGEIQRIDPARVTIEDAE